MSQKNTEAKRAKPQFKIEKKPARYPFGEELTVGAPCNDKDLRGAFAIAVLVPGANRHETIIFHHPIGESKLDDRCWVASSPEELRRLRATAQPPNVVTERVKRERNNELMRRYLLQSDTSFHLRRGEGGLPDRVVYRIDGNDRADYLAALRSSGKTGKIPEIVDDIYKPAELSFSRFRDDQWKSIEVEIPLDHEPSKDLYGTMHQAPVSYLGFKPTHEAEDTVKRRILGIPDAIARGDIPTAPLPAGARVEAVAAPLPSEEEVKATPPRGMFSSGLGFTTDRERPKVDETPVTKDTPWGSVAMDSVTESVPAPTVEVTDAAVRRVSKTGVPPTTVVVKQDNPKGLPVRRPEDTTYKDRVEKLARSSAVEDAKKLLAGTAEPPGKTLKEPPGERPK